MPTPARRAFESKAIRIHASEIRPGDVIDMLGGLATVTGIRAYNGPLTDIVLAIADTTRGGVSLLVDEMVLVLRGAS
jgi:hypothetical protein